MNYQFTSRHLTLDNILRSNQGHMTFKRLYLLNGASYQILHETYIYIINHIIMVFQFISWHLTLALKGKIKVSWCSLGCVSYNVLLDSGAFRPRGLLFIILIQLSQLIFGYLHGPLWDMFNCIPRTKYVRGILWFSRRYAAAASAASASADTSSFSR